uniref:Immunoglobulin V-set domain-containing protein n=1 Tax=Sphaeramia orbicularis TaxID=375764 RepID=A0A672Z6Z6_9TELE
IIQSSLENSVSISCPYKSEFLNSLKYICRGKQPSVCLQQAVVTSVNKLNRRFGLQDDKTSRHFTVTVTDVTKDDAGSYLCGVQRNNHLDEFNHIQLEVKGKKTDFSFFFALFGSLLSWTWIITSAKEEEMIKFWCLGGGLRSPSASSCKWNLPRKPG